MMIRKEMVRTLEFDRILQEISRYCHSDASRDAVLDILPLPEEDAIGGRFGMVEEIRSSLRKALPFASRPLKMYARSWKNCGPWDRFSPHWSWLPLSRCFAPSLPLPPSWHSVPISRCSGSWQLLSAASPTSSIPSSARSIPRGISSIPPPGFYLICAPGNVP